MCFGDCRKIFCLIREDCSVPPRETYFAGALFIPGHYLPPTVLFTMTITIHHSWSLFILLGIFRPLLLFIAGGTIHRWGYYSPSEVTIHRRSLFI